MSKTTLFAARGVMVWLAICLLPDSARADVTPSHQPGNRTSVGHQPLSIADTLEFREIRNVRMAPSGKEVAYVTRHALLERKKNEDSLLVIAADGGESRVMLTADRIAYLEWDWAGHSLFALVEREKRQILSRIEAVSGRIEELWTTEEPIDHLALSPDRTVALVSTVVRSSQAVVRQRVDFGFVYDYEMHTLQDLISRDYADAEALQVAVLDLRTRSARPVMRIPFHGYKHLPFVQSAVIAPDDRKAALILVRRGEPDRGGAAFNYDLAVLDLQTGDRQEPIVDAALTAETAPAWLGDSRRLFFASSGRGLLYDTERKTLAPLAWVHDLPPLLPAGAAVYDSSRERIHIHSDLGLQELSLRSRTTRHVPGSFGEASFTERFDAYAFVSQSSNEWPEVAVHRLKKSDTRRLTNVNAALAGRALGTVEALTVTNPAGVRSNAWLLYPIAYERGRRYPMIVATYGFRGRFPIIAEWHTSFPAQVLAGKGYAVLMLNRPEPSGQSFAHDPPKARDLEGWQMLSTFESAVALMVERGIADPDRLGIYGWSHGGFIVEFLLAHSKVPFRAAALGEGGDYKPGGYWMFGSASWPRIYENLYGGPMSSKTIDAYLQFSPGLGIDRFRAPLLLEFAGGTGLSGLETYVQLRELHKPAELVFYDGEEHNFVRPAARFASMNRKVDWFDFWIRGEEDSDPAKAGQYARWKKMREESSRLADSGQPP